MKAAPGTHTMSPTSPTGDSRMATVSEDGNSLTDQGIVYAYNPELDRYQARVPPPPANPPGLWHFITFNEGQEYNVYEMTDQGHTNPTEIGHDYPNG